MANRARRVVQCDKSGKKIRVFPSAKDASSFMGSKYATSIHRSIAYGMMAFGYRWKYEGEELKPLPIGNPGKKQRIVSINILTGEEIIHESLSKTAANLNLGLTAIESALSTGGKIKDYRFRYLDKELINPSKKNSYKRAVLAIDEEGIILKRWDSVILASLDLGVITSTIYSSINRDNPKSKCKGYHLIYEEDHK